MKIATWNVNGLRARMDYVLHWLQARQPDVVGFQELKMADEVFPTETFEALGYNVHVHGQKAWNGVAILSKQPASVTQTGLPGEQELGSRLITAQIGELSFTTVYCPNGKNLEHADYARKLQWFDALSAYMQPVVAASKHTVICGDFNICPTGLDSWDDGIQLGGMFHTDAERERMTNLYSLGLRDLYRAQHPDAQMFSWWDYRAGSFQRNHGLRIDFMLACANTQASSTEIDRDYRKKIDGLTASDHAPVITVLA